MSWYLIQCYDSSCFVVKTQKSGLFISTAQTDDWWDRLEVSSTWHDYWTTGRVSLSPCCCLASLDTSLLCLHRAGPVSECGQPGPVSGQSGQPGLTDWRISRRLHSAPSLLSTCVCLPLSHCSCATALRLCRCQVMEPQAAETRGDEGETWSLRLAS